ncbi:MAG: DUF167 domain-containing protein [Rhodospirillales bacterium]|nr:DUF167 domain-containing protein [Rhodospirillales bacterium]MCB9996712.1 DUF167 domain-containing protein [Rhodospirillales bacterium]
MSDCLELPVRLTPKASRNQVGGWVCDDQGQDILKISVTAVPEKGKANKALIALLAKHLKIPKSDITIIRGETDRNKILKINNISNDTLKALCP